MSRQEGSWPQSLAIPESVMFRQLLRLRCLRDRRWEWITSNDLFVMEAHPPRSSTSKLMADLHILRMLWSVIFLVILKSSWRREGSWDSKAGISLSSFKLKHPLKTMESKLVMLRVTSLSCPSSRRMGSSSFLLWFRDLEVVLEVDLEVLEGSFWMLRIW